MTRHCAHRIGHLTKKGNSIARLDRESTMAWVRPTPEGVLRNSRCFAGSNAGASDVNSHCNAKGSFVPRSVNSMEPEVRTRSERPLDGLRTQHLGQSVKGRFGPSWRAVAMLWTEMLQPTPAAAMSSKRSHSKPVVSL